MKLLITTDLSDEALRPLSGLRDLTGGRPHEVTLLHVVPVQSVAPPGGPRAPVVRPIDLDGQVRKARTALAALAEKHADVAVSTDVITATDVAAAICTYAEENDVGMIAMSTHGRTGFRRLVLGSVAEQVLRHSPVPVLVYPRRS